MPVELAALPIALSGSVPAATTIMPVRVLLFQRDTAAIERGKGAANLTKLKCSIGHIL